MKILDRVALALFSTIILVLSIIVCLLIFGWLDLNTVILFIKALFNDGLSTNIILGIAGICILLAIKCIFFETTSKETKDISDGIMLQNENGKLLVSKNTIQNLVTSVVKEFEEATDAIASSKVNKEGTIDIDVTIYVLPDAIIKDLSSKLQVRIKEIMKSSLDIEINAVNVKVKDITIKERKNNNVIN